jgi:tetratricopeptide (TPR) repeat protein
LLFFSHGVTLAQASKSKADSAKAARERAADSLRKARARQADSLKEVRQQRTDSLQSVRKHRTDSMAAITKYKNSRKYRDSVAKARKAKTGVGKDARQGRLDSMAEVRARRTDSLTQARKARTDSMAAISKYKNSRKFRDSVARARKEKMETVKDIRQGRLDSMAEARARRSDSLALVRQTRTDSLKSRQKKRNDSLAVIKKYKGSKRYADSVTIAKHQRTDSIKAVQTAYRDSIATERKKTLDAVNAARKHTTDSLKAVRTHFGDSLKIARKSKTDSMAKRKVEKEKFTKAKEKKKEDLTKLKLELKIKQKREAWSNKDMLKKKWSPVRSVTQNAFTHYNYYFNANRKMDEALLNMQRARRENFDTLIALFPFDPNKDSSLMSADMDSIVHKVSVGIQIHDPRVKWSNDMYLLLGQAYYYKGNYENAAIAFRFIIASDEEAERKNAKGGSYKSKSTSSKSKSKSKGGPSIVQQDKKSMLDFLKHKSVHNEAILWLARTYTTANKVEDAEAILSLLESDVNLPSDLKGRLAIEKAFAYMASDNHSAASAQLTTAVGDKNLPSWLRQRAAFLNGQLLQEQEHYKDAAHSFDAVLDFYPKIEMDFYARKYQAYNRLMAGENSEEAFAALKKILNDAKYSTYYDQVYYVLGQLALKANKKQDAITYFTKSTRSPKAAKKQKALSFAALGDAYYSTAEYTSAKAAYDSAAKYSSGNGKDATIAAAVQKSKVLSEISGPVKIIHDQDSLLALAAMSKKEQQSVVRAYLRQLEKARQDSLDNAENVGAKEVEAAEPIAETTGWYFSNPLQMQQGSADFKRKWGTRPLVDNWRRVSSGGGAVVNNSNTGQETEEEGTGTGKATAAGGNALTEENLMAKIPNTQSQKDAAVKAEQKAYMALAKAYVKQLEDYPRALHTLDTLDKRYPGHVFKEDELYLRYQIAIKQNQLDKAQAYSKELLAQFPNSQYAGLLRPSSESDLAGKQGDKAVAEYFDETYKLLLQHQYTEVLMRTNYAQKQYNHPTFKKRFQIVEASANAGMGNYDTADTLIAAFIKAYPGDSLTTWAGTVQEYIKQVRNGGKPSWYKEGPLSTASSSTTTTTETKEEASAAPAKPAAPARPANVPYSFSYQPDSEHYAMIVLPGLDSRTADLKRNVKSFDAAKYAKANLEVLMDLYDITEGVMVIRKFSNASLAKTYLNDLSASTALNGYAPGELKLLLISAANYRKMFYDQVTYPYASFYDINYK